MQENKIKLSLDAVLTMTVLEAENIEISNMPTLKEMNDEFKRSKKFKELARKTLNKTKRRIINKKIRTAFTKTALTFSVIITLFTATLAPVQAVQEAVIQTLIQWEDEFSAIIFSTNYDTQQIVLPENIELKYIPDGYILDEDSVFITDDIYYAIYKNDDNIMILEISTVEGNYVTNIDNQNSRYIILTFNEIEAIYTEFDDGLITVTFNLNNLYFQFIGNLNISEVVKIIENLKIS